MSSTHHIVEVSEMTDEEAEIMDMVNSFFKVLYEKTFVGKKWDFVHSISGNLIIMTLRNISYQLFKCDTHFKEEAFSFIDAICSIAKIEIEELHLKKNTIN